MGKHGGGSRSPGPVPLIIGIVAVAAVLGLGWWWWSLRGDDDPISADPVSAYATVLDSDACTVPAAHSTVRFPTPSGPVTAAVHACGYAAQQGVLVEYLASDVSQVRPASTTSAEPSVGRRLLPLLILLVGLLGAGALLALVRNRRDARHSSGGGSRNRRHTGSG